ncbi:MAG: hypothetical protein ACFFBD_00525 [Candidatus Hodarchaeota archaeon]
MLHKLNLDEDQKRVLLLLLGVGSLEESEIANFLHLDIPKVQSTCQQLEKVQYARRVPGIGARWAASYPFKALSAENKVLVEKMQEIGTTIDSFTSERFRSLENIVTATEEKIVTSIQNGKSSVSETRNTTAQTLETQLQAEKEKLPSHKTKAAEEVEKILENHALEEQKAFGEFVEIVSNRSQESENTILGSLQQNSEEAKNQIEALVPEKKQQVEEFRQNITTLGSNYIAKAKNFVENTQSNLEEGKTTLLSEATSIQNQSIQQKDQIVDQIKADKQTILNETKSTTSTKVEDFRAKVALNSTNFKEKISSGSAGTINHGKEKTQETKANFETEVRNIQSQSSIILAELTQKVQKLSSTFTADTESLMKDFTEKTTSMISNFQSETTSMISNFQSETTSMISNFQSEGQSTVSEATKQINELINKSLEISSTLETNTIDNLNEVEESIKTSLETTVEEQLSFLNEAKQKIVTDLDEALQTSNDKIDDQITAFSEKATDSFNEITQKTRESVENFATSTINNLSGQFTDLDSTVTDNITRVETTMNDEMATFEKLVQDLVNHIITASTSMSDQVSSEYTNWRSTSAELVEQSKSKSSMIRSNVQSETASVTEKMLEETQNAIDLGMKILTSSLEKVETDAHSALDEASGYVKVGIEKEINDLKTGIAGFGEQFTNSAQNLQTVLSEFDKEVATLGETVNQTSLPNYNSIPILGKKAVLDYISEMFNRVKSGMTLLIPNPSEIPIDKIEATKTTQRITIVTRATPETHADLLKRLLVKPNVRVRNLTISSELTVNIAAEREGEEVLISTTQDADNIGFASMSEGYVQLFGRIVIGNYFLAQSKEIKRVDLGL